jgi:hypothetical protein
MARRWLRQHQNGFELISHWTWWVLVGLALVVVLVLLVIAGLIWFPFAQRLIFGGSYPVLFRLAYGVALAALIAGSLGAIVLQLTGSRGPESLGGPDAIGGIDTERFRLGMQDGLGGVDMRRLRR